jgi:hypothetical protein
MHQRLCDRNMCTKICNGALVGSISIIVDIGEKLYLAPIGAKKSNQAAAIIRFGECCFFCNKSITFDVPGISGNVFSGSC